MTCIIGLEEDGRVYMGGDSCTTAGYETRTIKGKKVFFIGKNAQILVGASGSGRMTQILQYNFKPPPFGTFEAEEYLCKLFVPKLRKAIRKHGYIHTENQTENISENGSTRPKTVYRRLVRGANTHLELCGFTSQWLNRTRLPAEL